jgi:hypothetical protein
MGRRIGDRRRNGRFSVPILFILSKIVLINPMSANALRPVCDSREQAPWQPSYPALSGSDRHDLAVSQGLDIANWGPAKESPVLAIELARAFVSDLERRTCRIQFTREHALPRGMQAKLLLKLQRTHRRKGAKMEMQRRSTHACNRCQVLYP